jgi:hypothetical protein
MAISMNFKSITDGAKIALETSNLAGQSVGQVVNGATQIGAVWQETEIKKENEEAKEIEMIKPAFS